MRYLAVLIVPLLMLADYYLTLYGASLKQRSGYDRFFVSEHYELNPTFQADVARLRWFNPRHLYSVGLLLFALEFLAILANLDVLIDALFQLVLGDLCILYLSIIGKHLQNILTFRYIQSYAAEVSGQISISYLMSLRLSQYQYLPVFLAVLCIAWVTQSMFAIGGVFGTLHVIFSHWLWQRRYQVRVRKHARSVEKAPAEH